MIYKRKNFKEETKTLFLKYAFIPVVLLFLLFFVFLVFFLFAKLVYDTNQASKQIYEEFTTVYDEYLIEVERMATLPAVQEYLQTGRNSNLVFEAFYDFNNEQMIRSVFHLVDSSGDFLLSSKTPENDTTDFNLTNFIRRLKNYPEEILIGTGETAYTHGEVAVFSIGKAIIYGGEVRGFLIFQWMESDLLDLLSKDYSDISVVTDQYNNIIVTTNRLAKNFINKFIPTYTSDQFVDIKNSKYFIRLVETDKYPFKVYSLNMLIIEPLYILLYIVFAGLIGLTLYFFLNYLAEKMSSQNSRSIEKLMEGVNRLKEGKLDSYVHLKTGDEFEVLANQFNNMLDHLNSLMKRNEELSNIRRINEIKFLESQFNPHFLFNALETIRYTMFMDTKKAEHIILTLSKLLRYSINKDQQIVLFKHDLDYIVDYLSLHKLRYNERLEYEIRVPESIQYSFVPKLLLQPIIENSIKFGYRTKSHLKISIEGIQEGNEILLKVIDNGSGISQEKMEEIQKILSGKKKSGEHIGLLNAHKRLALQYGEHYGLTIHSDFGKGTEVILKLPFKNSM
ncbi:sensor histidine kinase [Fervidibacillus halotolerans]|uniref:histidine kinase n=1 Tax=Fervidibacillus halotolerans TaxID=2980027 RepID=A0A9E8M0S5_9BACI|nr:histidine kinase [Fervidibacillus halotolerans]WAA13099.1 histidine kinase [Fervidibacillus halotolerans]